MRELIHERVREFACQSLRRRSRRSVAVGTNQRGFRAEKSRKAGFKLCVNFVVAGSEARSGDIQAIFSQCRAGGLRHFRISGEPEIVATGKISKDATLPAHFIVADKLQRLRLSHERIIDFAPLNCTREYALGNVPVAAKGIHTTFGFY